MENSRDAGNQVNTRKNAVSSQKGINIGALVQALDQTIPEPVRDPNAEPVMLSARSFDVNKPGCNWKDVKGGVV